MKAFSEYSELQHVHRVPVPESLRARIDARIQAGTTRRLPLRWAIAASIALMLLLGVNALVIANQLSDARNSDDTAQLAETMQLNPSNDFYHD